MAHLQAPVPANFAVTQQADMQTGFHYNYATEPYQDTVEDVWKLDPLKTFWFVIRYRWLIAAFLFAGIISGYMINLTQVPMYRTTAKIAIQTAGAIAIKDLESVLDENDWRIFETAREIMLSRDLARRVVSKLKLAENTEFLTPPPRFSLSKSIKQLFVGAAETPGLNISRLDAEKIAIGKVHGGVSAKIIKNTSVLAVTYSSSNPAFATEIANQYLLSFIDQNIERKAETSNQALQFIEKKVNETKLKLQSSERTLLAYVKKVGLKVTREDSSLVSKNISDINAALSVAIQKRLLNERYVQQIKDGDSASLPEVFQSNTIHLTKQKLAELRASYKLKLTTLKPSFPVMLSLKAEINELNKQMRFEISAIARSVKVRYEQSKINVVALQNKLNDLDLNQSVFQEKNIQYTILKREVKSNRRQYEALIEKQNRVGIGSEIKFFNAQIIDTAIAPGSPYSSKKFNYLVMSLGLFGALAAAVIYLMELMNNTFSVPNQLESDLKVPVLGVIPEVPEDELADAFRDPTSPFSEAHRTLRTSIQFTGTEDHIKTILVTSTEKSEGKTSTAFRLAADFAALDRKVLVIDADLRRPKMHRMFGTDNKFGLSNLLTNVFRSGQTMDLFRSTGNPNITFLSSGTIPPNPTDILSSKKMRKTLEFCSEKFDLVIVDSPPVMGLSDAPILARQVDATIMVVSSKQVTRHGAKSSVTRLQSVGANLAGCVLTKFAVNKLDYNYAFQYMKYSNEGYEDDAPVKAKLMDRRIVDKAKPTNSIWHNKIIALFFNQFNRRAS